jgi:putative transcriptional regulator
VRTWLKELRIKHNMTQAQLANKAEIARTTYSMIELGERGITVDTAKKLAKVLSVKWTIFFEDECHETRNSETQEVC